MSARRDLTARLPVLLALALVSVLVLTGGRTESQPEAASEPAPPPTELPAASAPTALPPGRVPRPEVIKAIYLTSWSAATPARLAKAFALIDRTELNAVVIDVKDYTGTVAFRTGAPLVARMGSEVDRLDLAALVRRFHERAIYVVVRIAAFQDHHLATARPDLAVRDATGHIWRDRQGLGWVDPAAQEVWAYLAAVGRAAAAAGADELNFDYLRFPSDGRLEGLRYPFFDARTGRRRTIRQVFEHLVGALRPTGAVLSADLFGQATVAAHDLGIGQILEDALLYFDYVAPMVYPSHYARGFLSFRNPAAHPYEVVHYSMRMAEERRSRLARLMSAFTDDPQAGGLSGQGSALALARLRPWLQAFDLGAPYPPPAVRAQIRAVYDAGGSSGWYLWSPLNTYDQEALEEPTDRRDGSGRRKGP